MSYTLGTNIKEARKAKSLTQADLAKDICTPSMISQIETGKVNPSDQLIDQIAAKLGVSVASLNGKAESDTLSTTSSKNGLSKSAIAKIVELKNQKQLKAGAEANGHAPTGHPA